MTVLTAACRHEWRRMCRDRAVPWLLLLYAAISGYAAWQGSNWVDERRAALEQVSRQATHDQAQFLSRLAESVKRDPGMPIGLFLGVALEHRPVLPLAPLAPLTVGQSQGYPFEAKLHAVANPTRIFGALGPSIDNPATLAAGPFDLSFVIVFLLPLFLLAASFDLWTHERDLGTSGLLLSQPADPARILAAKVLVRGGTLLIAFTIVGTVALLTVIAPEPRAIPALLQSGIVMLLYGALWIAVALAFNVTLRSSTEAALGCGTVWLLLVVLLPALLSATQDIVRPAPSRADYTNELRTLELQIRDRPRQKTSPAPQINARVHGLRDALHNARDDGDAYAVVTEKFRRARSERHGLAQVLRFLSPAIVAQDALERIAGTDADRARAFEDQVIRFLPALQEFAATRVDSAATTVAAQYRAVPKFRFQEPAGGSRFVPLLSDLCVLSILGLAVVGRSWLVVRRRALFKNESGEAC